MGFLRYVAGLAGILALVVCHSVARAQSSSQQLPPVEVNPNPDPQISLPTHQIMLVINGIHLLENMKLDELAAKRVYEFAFIIEPLKIQGATGSTVAPIAIH